MAAAAASTVLRASIHSYADRNQAELIANLDLPRDEIERDGYKEVLTRHLEDYIRTHFGDTFKTFLDKRATRWVLYHTGKKRLYDAHFCEPIRTSYNPHAASDAIAEEWSGERFFTTAPIIKLLPQNLVDTITTPLETHVFDPHSNDTSVAALFGEETDFGGIFPEKEDDDDAILTYPQISREDLTDHMVKYVARLILCPTVLDRYDGGIAVVSEITSGLPFDGFTRCNCS